MEKLIDIRGLTKHYSGFSLQDVNLTIASGTITGLVGANGAGKSTTLKLILNLVRRDAGNISIFGMDNIRQEKDVKARIGVVFDEPCFHDLLTPRHIGRYMAGLYPTWDESAYTGFLKQFGLPENKTVKEYSRGMKMKLSIATAMSHHPQLLILDEPTSGLDPLVRDEILDMFLEFLQDENRSILLSSHITSDLDKIADTIALMDNGRLIFHEEKDVLRETFALIRGGDETLDMFDPCDLTGLRKNAFGFEALCRRETLKNHSGVVAERPTIEEIMLFFTRKDKFSAERREA